MEENGMTIRRADASDVEAFRQIRLEALQVEPSSYASNFEDWVGLSEEEWQTRLSEPVFLAFQGGEPVGLTGLLRQRSSKLAHRATIVMVYVRKGLRGTGLASGLLNATVDHAREIGIRQLELTVSAEQPAAIRFYQREGFTEVGCIPGGLLQEGREIDEFVMVRRIG